MARSMMAGWLVALLCACLWGCSDEDTDPDPSQGGATTGGGGTGGSAGDGGRGGTWPDGGGTPAGGGGTGGEAPDPIFRVAACQYVGGDATTKAGKRTAMQQALTDLADVAVAGGADMLVFPETTFASYDCAPRPALAEDIPSTDTDDVYPHMADYAEQNGVWLYYGDYVVSSNPSRPYNAGIMIRPDGSLGFIYDKHYGSSSEAGCGTYGVSAYTFDIGHPLGTIGCLICKDFHAGGTGDIDGLDFDFMLGVAWDSNRTGNNYEGHMRQIITTAPAKQRGGIWVNMGDDEGQSFFMDAAGTIVEEATGGGGNQILYRDYTIP